MGKITLTVPDKFEAKLRKEAVKRKIPLNRHISQVLMTVPRNLLAENQFLRQEIFVLKTKVINKEEPQNGIEL